MEEQQVQSQNGDTQQQKLQGLSADPGLGAGSEEVLLAVHFGEQQTLLWDYFGESLFVWVCGSVTQKLLKEVC